MDYYELHIDGKHFKQNYLVYVVELKSKAYGTFYYIGQTGNRNHKIARSSFLRLSVHFSDAGYSTQNQIYRQIVTKILNLKWERNKKFTDDIKRKVSNFLEQNLITIKAFPIKNFDFSMDKEMHIQYRKEVEEIEKILIKKFINQFGIDKILNKNIPNNSYNNKLNPQSEEIFNSYLSIIK